MMNIIAWEFLRNMMRMSWQVWAELKIRKYWMCFSTTAVLARFPKSLPPTERVAVF